MPAKKLSRTMQLAEDLLQFKASDILTLAKAYKDIKKADKQRYMASGVIITIQNLSGTVIVESVMISDGLSDATISALQADIKATYDFRLLMNKI